MAETEQRLIRFEAVAARVGLARTAIYTRIEDGSFPAPVKVWRGSRSADEGIRAWVAPQIEEYRGARNAQR